MRLKQNIHYITLGVKDLNKMKMFYKNVFGWQPLSNDEGIAFFKVGGMILGLYPIEELKSDIGIPLPNPLDEFKGFSLSINFDSENEVDSAFALLKNNGVQIIKEPQRVFWGGYSCYVADVENNFWELAYNPFIKINDAGFIE